MDAGREDSFSSSAFIFGGREGSLRHARSCWEMVPCENTPRQQDVGCLRFRFPSLLSQWASGRPLWDQRAAPHGHRRRRFCLPAAVRLPATHCRRGPWQVRLFSLFLLAVPTIEITFFFSMERNPLPFHNLSHRHAFESAGCVRVLTADAES